MKKIYQTPEAEIEVFKLYTVFTITDSDMYGIGNGEIIDDDEDDGVEF